jgi:hypothetical protein
VSLPTVSRTIRRLRARAINVMTVRWGDGWHYEVRDELTDEEIAADPLVQDAGSVRRWKRREGVSEDEIIYGRD